MWIKSTELKKIEYDRVYQIHLAARMQLVLSIDQGNLGGLGVLASTWAAYIAWKFKCLESV